ncbi:REP-associated tyrosine transposase [Teredinibacter haidensis]|uniref:REP-associated tyrosine transposase n=1 Tax=Teredinibacter haidensis TaxID=2731755 RepID=UPI00163D3B8F|nr:transposase [Teredinibacter haidensis]
MARPLRLEFAGALYHITSRGNRREDIYLTDKDRELFLAVLTEACDRYNWVCHAYCQMSNHYHLLIETPDANLSKGMRHLNGVYTQRFNHNHTRFGHVFQGRYKAILVDKNGYLLEVARYIVLNPVRAGMVRHAKDWPWSSYRATIGQAKETGGLQTEWLLAAFGHQKTRAITAYKDFVRQGKGQPSLWGTLKNQVYLGDEEFVEQMQQLIDGSKELSEIPSSQRRAAPKPLAWNEAAEADRNTAISQAYASGGYSMKEIGEHFGLHYSRVSRILRKAKGKT